MIYYLAMDIVKKILMKKNNHKIIAILADIRELAGIGVISYAIRAKEIQ